ncbi:hypothetical protein [Herminiimonas contaminans]|uniref:Peptidase M15-like protein n=1 Tax=Herminiimonas contaminans TaxID=1111140 RepID=A0ABS0EQ01_9BURK|nr:hypothetical protein [Herminiimonas contaminans]MBF8176933.1 hypothetical protein [Herminiimonas contaminans]
MSSIAVVESITLAQYFMNRERLYGSELTAEYRANAALTVERINKLIAAFSADGVVQEIRPDTKSPVSSGWRPGAINAGTKGAAPRSKHLTCQACDLYDPDGDIDAWALKHPEVLTKIGLWQEHPSATKTWAHFQIVPPRSGNRVFYP